MSRINYCIVHFRLQRNLRKGFQTGVAGQNWIARNLPNGYLLSGEQWKSNRWRHHRETKRRSEVDACQWKKWRQRQRKHEQGLIFFLTVVNSEESMLGQYNLWLTYEIANCDGIHKPFDMSNVLSLVNPIHMSLFSDTSSISGMVCPNTDNSDIIPFLYK